MPRISRIAAIATIGAAAAWLGWRSSDALLPHTAAPGGAPEGRVLATIDGRPLTEQEFEGLRPQFPVDPSLPDDEARRAALMQVIEYKLVAAQALERFPVDGFEGFAPEERSRAEHNAAMALIRAEVASPDKVSDAEAWAYLEAHPGAFPQAGEGVGDASPGLLGVKFAVLAERWRERVDAWRSEAEIRVLPGFETSDASGGSNP